MNTETKGSVRAMLGESLMLLRMLCKSAEQQGDDMSHVRDFIEEAEVVRWAA